MSEIAERIAKLSPKRQELLGRLLKKDQIDLSQAVMMPRVRNSSAQLSLIRSFGGKSRDVAMIKRGRTTSRKGPEQEFPE